MARRNPSPGRPPEAAGRFAYEGLDRVIHEKARLGIMTSLVTHPAGLLFSDLKELCGLTDGNLNRHLHVLQEAGLVEVWKRTERKRPQTLCRLTDRGRAKFLDYLAALERVVADAAASAEGRTYDRFGKLDEGMDAHVDGISRGCSAIGGKKTGAMAASTRKIFHAKAQRNQGRGGEW